MYNEEEARLLVIEAGLKLVENKLIARTWGNISARISDEEFVITPSGRGYDSLKPEDLVTVKIEKCSYDGEIKPSSEKKIHAVAYKNRPECNFVIHTHQFYASSVAANGKDTDFAPCAKYGLPGSDRLKNNVEECVKNNPTDKMFLMEKHGTLLIGDSYEDAFNLAEELEIKSEKQFRDRVPSMDSQKQDPFDVEKIKTKEMPYVKLIQDPYVMECCYAGLDLKPYIDDFAQIVGPDAHLCPNNYMKVKFGLVGRNAALVRDVGAVCVGKDQDDVDAIAIIVSKNCASACYARNTKPLSVADANLQRYVYLKKYSKLK